MFRTEVISPNNSILNTLNVLTSELTLSFIEVYDINGNIVTDKNEDKCEEKYNENSNIPMDKTVQLIYEHYVYGKLMIIN